MHSAALAAEVRHLALPRIWVPHTPDLLWGVVRPRDFMRLSLQKAAHVALDGVAYRKSGYLPTFFVGRCGKFHCAFPATGGHVCHFL
jgi:hypothetical protein